MIWNIRVTTCLIGFRNPRIGVVTPRIRSITYHITNGNLTPTRNCHKSEFFIMIFAISFSSPSLFTITYEHDVK